MVPAPLSPEIDVFHALDLVEAWAAAERLAGTPVPSPFWAYPWPGGSALARVVLDNPEWVRGQRVLDLGCGGGVASLAAAKAGATEVIANDLDPWALATVEIAAARNGVAVRTLQEDLTREGAAGADGSVGAGPARVARRGPAADVVLCGDLAYEKATAAAQREWLDSRRRDGARVLVANAGRAYFDFAGMTLIAVYRLPVPRDLEGVEEREVGVYEVTTFCET